MSEPRGGSTLESNQAAGTRLELLLFRLEGKQLFGINVFKVREVIPYQPLTRPAGAHPLIKGMATLRGVTMPIIDLSQAVGGPPMADPKQGYIIITEYNRSVHGFLIHQVERIVNTQWDQVQQMPSHLGRNIYVTAVTLIQGDLIEILDVEKVLDQVVHVSTEVSGDISQRPHPSGAKVLVVDDSAVARHQIQRALEQLGVDCTLMTDGLEALEEIRRLQSEGVDVARYFSLIISDIEMPEMDGYQFTTEIRKDARLENLYILLHSSLSGQFNIDMVQRTGANKFIQKYSPDDLAEAVLERLGNVSGAHG